MNVQPVLLGILACVPAFATSTFDVSAAAAGCSDTGEFTVSCSGTDGSFASAGISPFAFGVQTILDAHGSSQYTGPFGGQASAQVHLDIPLALHGRSGTAWVTPSIQRDVNAWTSGTIFSGAANFLAYLDTPDPVQMTLGQPFSVALAVNANVFADSSEGEPIRSHVDGRVRIDKFVVYLHAPGTPGLQKLNGAAGLTGNFEPSMLEVWDVPLPDIPVPEPGGLLLLAPVLLGFLVYRSR